MMIEKKLINLHTKHIDTTDDFFQYRPIESCDSLRNSIQRIGLVNPVIVQQKDLKSFRIVCGFRRIAALFDLKIDTLQALVIAEMQPNVDLFMMAVLENQSVKPLNPIEISTVLSKLQTVFNIDEKEIVRSCLPTLGYGQNPRVLQLYRDLHTLSREWQTAVNEDFVSLDVADDILKLAEYDRAKIWHLIQSLHLGKNRQREFLSLLKDISRINNSTISQLVDSQPVQTILNDTKQTPSQKSERIKQWLWEKRYPRYAAAKTSFEKKLRQARLPGNVHIQSPPFFEGDTFSTTFTFTGEQDFKKTVVVLEKLISNGYVKNLTDIL